MSAAAMQSSKVVSHGLDHSLVYHPTTGLLSRRDRQSTLPGQPWATLTSNKELLTYVQRNHGVSSYEWVQVKLGYFATNRLVAPLHAIGRIHLTEHPDLHLAKSRSGVDESRPEQDFVYLKPIPIYMLSTAFWAWLAATDTKTHAAALGFMRTYIFLIRYETDFRLATELALIPRIPAATDAQTPNGSSSKREDWLGDYRLVLDEGTGGRGYKITYEGFVEFIAQFTRPLVTDADMALAPRYRYGELNLHGSSTYRDYNRKLVLEPSEQQEEEEHKHNTSISKDDAKNIGKVDPASDLLCNFFLSGAFGLGLGFPVVWWWNEAHWAVQLFLLGPLGGLAVLLLLCMLLGLSVCVYEAAESKDKTVPGEKEEDKEKEAEKGKDNETDRETKEKDLLIEGLDMV
ncbi:hypothetical protein PG984_003423 [Apiospora sp. TS-2023a]